MHIEDSEAQLGADGGAGPPPIDLGMASGALKVVDAATMILERNTIHDRYTGALYHVGASCYTEKGGKSLNGRNGTDDAKDDASPCDGFPSSRTFICCTTPSGNDDCRAWLMISKASSSVCVRAHTR